MTHVLVSFNRQIFFVLMNMVETLCNYFARERIRLRNLNFC